MGFKTRIHRVRPRTTDSDVRVLTTLIEQGWDQVFAQFNVGEDAVFVLGRRIPWWRKFLPRAERIVFPEDSGYVIKKF